MYVKQVRHLTIEDLERMRGPEYLGAEADTMIEAMWRIGRYRGFSDEEIPAKTMEEMFQFDAQRR